MCGICGVTSFAADLDAGASRNGFEAMLAALAHRGPDDVGAYESPRAMMGATRLAIRGLSDGAQPMVDPETGVVVVCTGEIDNHRELRAWLATRGRTITQACDVWVLPALYLELGEAMVERLRGVFAIAIWDPRSNRVVLARDRAGERPLFFHAGPDGVRFATELAALACACGACLAPSEPDIQRYLQLGVFRAPGTPFQAIAKLGPAEVAVVDASGVRRRRYWRWLAPPPARQQPRVEAFDAVFRDAVRTQTDVEVDYGVFMSGGLDSSLVAAVLRSVRPEPVLRAYTVRFREVSYDEGSFAEEVAERLKMECVAVWMEPGDVPSGIARIVRRVGEPLADPAWLPTVLLSERAHRDVRMALVGEGADELFGGYPTYLGLRFAEYYPALPRPVRRVIRRVVEAWPPTDAKVAISFLLKRFVAAEGLTGHARHVFWTSSIPPPILGRLGVAPFEPSGSGLAEASLLDRAQAWDLETSLAEGLLTKADRGSMSTALELRAPFLDRLVMEFAATLPERERISGLTTKVFLKRYAMRYLPRGIVERRKRGLSVPLAGWLRGPLFEWARTRLGSELLDGVGVSSKAALELLEEHRARSMDHARTLWSLAVLVEWLEFASSHPLARVPGASSSRRGRTGRLETPPAHAP